jgi:hypothetical protein
MNRALMFAHTVFNALIAIAKKTVPFAEGFFAGSTYAAILLLGFPNRVLCTRFHPQRSGHCVPLSFSASGAKIQATRWAGGR